jgi:hypothetical protein
MKTNRTSVWLALLLLGAGAACMSTQLEVAQAHPANPAAPTAPLPEVGEVWARAPSPSATVERASEPAQSAQWTCPMHPEVIRPEPGNCPICGMKLVPKKAQPDKPVPKEAVPKEAVPKEPGHGAH